MHFTSMKRWPGLPPYVPGLPRRGTAAATARNNLVGRSPKQVSFNTSRLWIAPLTTGVIISVAGRGENGTAAYDQTVWTEYKYRTTYTVMPDNSMQTTGPFLHSTASTTEMAPLPGDYCDPIYTDSNGYSAQDCYSFSKQSSQEHVDATTGLASSAFGITFAGGSGAPAVASEVRGPFIAPGSSHAITVGPGGFVTLVYFE